MNFRQTIEVPNQPEIAKVNRKTGDLFVSSRIWDNLPSDEKQFVLYHEDGHLVLQTADEYAANAYAIDKFVPENTLTNQALGQKIMVMRSILDKADDNFSPFTGIEELGSATQGLLGTIFQALPVLGVGSKARVKETEANAQLITAQAAADAEKAKATTKAIIIGGTLILVLTVIILILKK